MFYKDLLYIDKTLFEVEDFVGNKGIAITLSECNTKTMSFLKITSLHPPTPPTAKQSRNHISASLLFRAFKKRQTKSFMLQWFQIFLKSVLSEKSLKTKAIITIWLEYLFILFHVRRKKETLFFLSWDTQYPLQIIMLQDTDCYHHNQSYFLCP